ncbi:MAG: porin family protein [Bacteroidales bacterium]|jgi:opacity protein-like surface antigen|nr:porin family protein [Bacteroidales bacterium]
MKKIVIISIAMLFMAFSANAQIFQYGLKGGLNYSSLAMDDIIGISDGTEVYDLLAGETVRGYQVGIMTRVNVLMLFVQPELYFNVTGGSVKKVLEDGTSDLLNVQFNRIDIPLLVGVKLGPARINVGPVGSAVVGSTNQLKELVSSDLETVSSGLTWGLQAGIGLDLFNKIAVDLRYEGSLSQYGDDSFMVGGMTHKFDARPTQRILAFGWWF